MMAAVAEIEGGLKKKQSKLSPLKREKKGHVEMSAGTSRLYLSLRAFIPQHAQH